MERPFLLESLMLEVGTVVANLARAGFPETGADAVKLWELETRSDVPVAAETAAAEKRSRELYQAAIQDRTVRR